jgi:hypothetical protein
MKKAIIALSLLALFASCKKKEYTCYCENSDKQLVFKKTMSELNYSEFQMYCDDAQRANQHQANGVTCTVLDKAPEETEEE